MFTTERTANALTKKINDAIKNNETEIELVIKSTGDHVKITLCSYVEIKSIDQIDYYLLECRFPWAGFDSIDKVANFLNNWDKKIEEDEKEKNEIKKYYEDFKGTEKFDYQWFSDWHKDVFGYRPHGKFGWE